MYDKEKLKSELIRDEGMKNFPYQDSIGKITIGIGRNITDIGLNIYEIDLLFENDVFNSVKILNTYFPYWKSIDDVRQRVLINMSFNMGKRILSFKNMLRAIQKNDWQTASQEMLNSKWASQVGDRAKRLAVMMLSGED